jgi:hypothetical protein
MERLHSGRKLFFAPISRARRSDRFFYHRVNQLTDSLDLDRNRVSRLEKALGKAIQPVGCPEVNRVENRESIAF